MQRSAATAALVKGHFRLEPLGKTFRTDQHNLKARLRYGCRLARGKMSSKPPCMLAFTSLIYQNVNVLEKHAAFPKINAFGHVYLKHVHCTYTCFSAPQPPPPPHSLSLFFSSSSIPIF